MPRNGRALIIFAKDDLKLSVLREVQLPNVNVLTGQKSALLPLEGRSLAEPLIVLLDCRRL